jgi:hypothetical protein
MKDAINVIDINEVEEDSVDQYNITNCPPLTSEIDCISSEVNGRLSESVVESSSMPRRGSEKELAAIEALSFMQEVAASNGVVFKQKMQRRNGFRPSNLLNDGSNRVSVRMVPKKHFRFEVNRKLLLSYKFR